MDGSRGRFQGVLIQFGRAYERQQRAERRARFARRFGDAWEIAVQLAACIVVIVIAALVLVGLFWMISEAGERWLAIPAGIGLLVLIVVAFGVGSWQSRRKRRRRRPRHGR